MSKELLIKANGLYGIIEKLTSYLKKVDDKDISLLVRNCNTARELLIEQVNEVLIAKQAEYDSIFEKKKTINVTLLTGRKGSGKTYTAEQKIRELGLGLMQKDLLHVEVNQLRALAELMTENLIFSEKVLMVDTDVCSYLPAIIRSGAQHIFICSARITLDGFNQHARLDMIEQKDNVKINFAYQACSYSS